VQAHAVELERLLKQCRPQLSRVLLRFRIPPQDADDLLQETFLILITRWDTVRCPEAWLAATLRNRCIIYWRRQRARLDDAMDSALLEVLAEPQPPPQERAELRRDLGAALSRLPRRQRRLLSLRFGFGCTSQETGDRLGYGAGSVRKMTQRCLARLTDDLSAGGLLRPPP
jgi:RNA polymerase sigma factor (sigma-70 family)